MKRFKLIIRLSDRTFQDLGITGTGEDGVARVIKDLGIEIEEVEGLDYWPDPDSY